MDRRHFLTAAAAGLALTATPGLVCAADLPERLPGAPPKIGVAERRGRLQKAQRMMRAQGLSALLVEPGASLIYFTGIDWSRSERLTCAIIPAEGDIGVVTPFFEEPSVRETLALPAKCAPGTRTRTR